AFVRSADERREVRDVSDEEFLGSGGGRDDDLLAASADVEIEGAWGEARSTITPFDPPILYGGTPGRPLYVIELVRTEKARDWFSVLSVLDGEGNPVKTHTVQVNSPLRHLGYRFFQATAQPRNEEGFAVSGISVTYQPGVHYMYVGYAVLVCGVSYIFYLKPAIARRQRRRRAPEAAA
ncbi:MAG: hypothetical protein ACREID_04220, partial [Planctomycetota bacterium]